MPPALRPPALLGRVFRGSLAVERGLLSPDALGSRCWRRLFRDVYADADLPDTHEVRIAGALLLCPADAVVSGWSAVHLHRLTDVVPAGAPVEVTVPPAARFGPVQGVRVRQAVLGADEIVLRGGWRCTSAVRTALDLARLAPVLESVPVLDRLLARGALTAPALQAAARGLPVQRGSRRAVGAVALTDARAESPPESRLRVLLTLAGLAPVPQFTVRRTDGTFVARVDLAFPQARVAVEYDGAWHASTTQLARDRRRLNALTAEGWRVLHVTAADLRQPELLVARLRRLLAADFRDLGA